MVLKKAKEKGIEKYRKDSNKYVKEGHRSRRNNSNDRFI
jgi:hypothetical protein